jgi:hypothetical protein
MEVMQYFFSKIQRAVMNVIDDWRIGRIGNIVHYVM